MELSAEAMKKCQAEVAVLLLLEWAAAIEVMGLSLPVLG
jgi:hypothetical protein